MVLHFNYHRGVGPNIPKNDVLNFAAYDNNGNLIGNGAWITTVVASKQTGFSCELSSYVNDGRIRSFWVDGRRYLFQEDVDRELKVPEGWWSEEVVVTYSGKHPDYLRRLKREGELVGKTVHKVPYYEPNSIREYFDAPKGTFTREDANDFLGVSGKKTLQRLVEQEIVSVQEKRGKNFYSIEDLRRHAGVPEGYISVRQGTKKFPYDEAEIKAIAAENEFQIIRGGNVIYIPEARMEEFASNHRKTLEEVITEIFDKIAGDHISSEGIISAIAERLGIGSNGHHANGSENGHSPHNGNGITLELIEEVVKGFE